MNDAMRTAVSLLLSLISTIDGISAADFDAMSVEGQNALFSACERVNKIADLVDDSSPREFARTVSIALVAIDNFVSRIDV